MQWLHRRTAALLTAVAAGAALTGCGGGGQGGGSDGLTVWTFEGLPERVKVQKEIFADFTERTGVQVDITTVAEDQFSQLLSSSAAAGDLPDVVGALTLAAAWEMHANELLDTQAIGDVLGDLGRDTFSRQALDLVSDDGTPFAVPSDGWTQLIVYREDLFEKAGLAPPTTYERLRNAAATLTGDGRVGIALATDPGAVFTQQSFEHLAMANGCQLVDSSAAVTLNTPGCVTAFELYGQLAREHSVRGAQDVDTTRATYFSGEAAMVIWSSFILDELAGLRDDALPSCEPCKDDPAFLAENSGVVTALEGPDGEPAQYGEVVSWGITSTANTEAAKRLVTYMMNEGYVRWLDMAPEGKIPTRAGTPDEPEKYTEAWSELEAGVDRKATLASIYSPEVIKTLQDSPNTFSRWGLPQGQGELVGAMLGELPVPKALNGVVTGELSASAAAKQAQAEVESIKESVS